MANGEVMSARKAVVVGGGPVGALTAIVLAKQGWKVQVLSAQHLCSQIAHCT